MSDDVSTPTGLNRLDTAWDNILLGISHDKNEKDPDVDAEAIPRIFIADQIILAATARRIWIAANMEQPWAILAPPRRRTIRRQSTASSSIFAGSGWLPTGLTAGIVALVVLGGVLFAGNRDHHQGLPGDASSVVATMVPALSATGTPGGEAPISLVPPVDESG